MWERRKKTEIRTDDPQHQEERNESWGEERDHGFECQAQGEHAGPGEHPVDEEACVSEFAVEGDFEEE